MKIGLLIVIAVVMHSCAPIHTMHNGVGKIKNYDFTHKDVPEEFDNYKIAFLTDFHYKSLFTQKKLSRLVETLNNLDIDLILLGGDYHAGCYYLPELFEKIAQIKSSDGIVAVMGNHDYAACYQDVVSYMKLKNIRLLEHQVDTVWKNNQHIIIAGIRDPFTLDKNGISPTNCLSGEDFVITLVHTPDYIEDVPVPNTDLALAGHTHGGQVTLFGLYAPVTNSKYGQRFRTGLKYNSKNIPVIISNGLGTSRRNIRLFAPSDLIVVKLKTQIIY